MAPFQVKICGITSLEDALVAAEAGADAIGLNFYKGSPRYVTTEQAQEIAGELRKRRGEGAPKVVGVFVNSEMEALFAAIAAVDLDVVQLHGDEPPEAVVHLNLLNADAREFVPWWARLFAPSHHSPSTPIVRAFRCRDSSLQAVAEYLQACQLAAGDAKSKTQPALPQGVLLDAFEPGSYGGTGKVVDWETVARERDLLLGVPIILAGGLTPANVAEAIRIARPDAVDTASGVESSPGKKDAEQVKEFVVRAKEAFAKG